MTNRTRIVIRAALLLALGSAPAAWSQTAPLPPGQLTDFVTRNASTPLQFATGTAIQASCTALVLAGGASVADPGQRDLFYRCNEQVGAATLINTGRPPANGRPLTNDPNALLAAIQQLGGEELATQNSLTNRVTAGQLSNIGGRINAIRLGGLSAASRGRVAQLGPERGPYSTLGFAPRSTAPSLDVDFFASLAPQSDAAAGGAGQGMTASPWGWFVEGSYATGDLDAEPNTDGFDFDSSSVTVGVDYNFGAGVIGASIGYDSYGADFQTAAAVSGGNVDVDGTSGSLFGAWFGDLLSLNGIVSYGQLDTDQTRIARYSGNQTCAVQSCVSDQTLVGNPDGDYISAGLTVGADFEAGGWALMPSLSLAYRKVKSDAFTERALNTGSQGFGVGIAYNEREFDSTRTILGAIASRPFSRSFGILTPNLRLEWHHEFEDDPVAVTGRFANDPAVCAGCGLTFPGGEVDTDFAVAALGLSATFARRLQGYIQYETLLGLSGLTSNAFSIGMRGQF